MGLWWGLTLPLAFLLVDGAATDSTTPSRAYFYVAEGEEKCFITNAVGEVPLTIDYETKQNAGVPCSISCKDPSGQVVFSRKVTDASPKGKLTYLPKEDGDYNTCIWCPTTQWFSGSKIKWSISLEIGDFDNLGSPLHADTAKKESVSELQRSLDIMLKRLDVISAENLHQRVQEAKFHQTSESVNWRFMAFGLMKASMLLGCTAFSVYHLSRFFHAQKLI